MRKRFLFALVLAVVAAAAVWWLRAERSERSAIARSETGAASDDTRAELATVDPHETVARTSIDPSPLVSSRSRPPASLDRTIPEGGERWTGMLVVVDEHGFEHPGESGSFRLLAWNDLVPSPIDIEVIGGRWMTPAHAGQRVTFAGWGDVGGRRAIVESLEMDLVVPLQTGPLLVRARWPAPTYLRVGSARDGSDLTAIDLLPSRWLSSAHPGRVTASRCVVVDATSPVAIPPSRDANGTTESYFVRAQGHAWASVDVDFAQGGERTVLLEPAGTLVIDLRGSDDARTTYVDVRREERTWPDFNFTSKRDRTHEVESVAEGRYVVAAGLGSQGDRAVLATTQVDVVAGSRTVALLQLEAPPPIEMAELSGTLTASEGWEADSLALVLRRENASKSGRDAPMRTLRLHRRRSGIDAIVYDWTFGKVELGSYRIAIDRIELSTSVEVEAGGRKDVHLVAPSPADVVVRVVDDESGEELEFARVLWNIQFSPEIAARTYDMFQFAKRDGQSGRYRFRAPRGTLSLHVHADGYTDHSQALEVRAGANEPLVRLSKAIELEIELHDASGMVLWPDDPRVEFEPSEGARPLPWSGRSSTKRWSFREPGRYRVVMPLLDGYEPIAERVVTVGHGQRAKLDIQLVRKR